MCGLSYRAAMATFLAHVQVRPGAAAEFEAVSAELCHRTHADERGVARYEYWRGAAQDSYYVLASFDGYDGFIRHQVSDHHTAATGSLRRLIAAIRLEWIDPVDGANSLPPTNGSAAPADAGDLELDYRRRQPADVQPWWIALRST